MGRDWRQMRRRQEDGRVWVGAGLGLLGLGLLLGWAGKGQAQDVGGAAMGAAAANGTKSQAEGDPGGSLQAVAALDLRRYAGEWYELARYPNRFQRKCVARVKAVYTYPRGGTDEAKVGVVNRCEQADGRPDVITGWGKRAEADAGDGRLKVTFFWPFFGDYWVFGLDPEYRWALVGEPKRRYLWVLSRTPQLGPGVWEELEGRVRAAGYDPGRLVRTVQ